MSRVLLLAMTMLLPCFEAFADEVEGIQSTAFTAATGEATDVFGSTGPVLLGLGMTALTTMIALLIFGAAKQRKCAATLDEIQAIVGKEDQ